MSAPRSVGRRHGWCGGVAAAPARARGGAGALPLAWPRRDARSRTRGRENSWRGSRAAPERASRRRLALWRRAAAERSRRSSRRDGAWRANTPRGARTPRPPAATAAWLAKAILAFSTRLAKLFSWFCSGNGDWRARVARSAPQADFMPNTAARARRRCWTSSCRMGGLCCFRRPISSFLIKSALGGLRRNRKVPTILFSFAGTRANTHRWFLEARKSREGGVCSHPSNLLSSSLPLPLSGSPPLPSSRTRLPHRPRRRHPLCRPPFRLPPPRRPPLPRHLS